MRRDISVAIEWCNKHKKHERVPACEPDLENENRKIIEELTTSAEEDNHVS